MTANPLPQSVVRRLIVGVSGGKQTDEFAASDLAPVGVAAGGWVSSSQAGSNR